MKKTSKNIVFYLTLAVGLTLGLSLQSKFVAAITMPPLETVTPPSEAASENPSSETTWPTSDPTSVPVNDAVYFMEDAADILTSEEETALQQTGEAFIRTNPDISLAMFTTNDTEGKATYHYGDDRFEANNLGYGPDFNGVYLLIDMDNREYYVGTFGKMIGILTDIRIERVLDEMQPHMQNGEYASAFSAAEEKIQEYITLGPPLTDEEEDPKSVQPVQIIASLGGFGLIGSATGLGYRKKVKEEYDKFAERPSYDSSKEATANYALIADNVIDKNTVSAYRPVTTTSSSSSRARGSGGGGRSTTHRTGGGRSSGGGGRGF